MGINAHPATLSIILEERPLGDLRLPHEKREYGAQKKPEINYRAPPIDGIEAAAYAELSKPVGSAGNEELIEATNQQTAEGQEKTREQVQSAADWEVSAESPIYQQVGLIKPDQQLKIPQFVVAIQNAAIIQRDDREAAH